MRSIDPSRAVHAFFALIASPQSRRRRKASQRRSIHSRPIHRRTGRLPTVDFRQFSLERVKNRLRNMFAAAAQTIAAPCVANHRVSAARQVKSTKAPRAAIVAAAAAEEPGSAAKGMGKNLPAAMDINDVMNLLPHRYPFLLVDRVVEIETGSYAIGVKNVTINDNFFPGHFPQRPIMPGVLMVEAMAQVGGLVMLEPGEEGEYARAAPL